MYNADKQDNMKKFYVIVRKHLVLIIAAVIVGAAIFGTMALKKQPLYVKEISMKFDGNELAKINLNANELINSKKLYKNIDSNSLMIKDYKDLNKVSDVDEDSVSNWVLSQVEVKLNDKNYNIVNLKITSTNKTLIEDIQKSYIEATDKILKQEMNLYYEKMLEYYDKKIEVIKDKEKSVIEDKTSFNGLSVALDQWGDAKLKKDNYVSPITITEEKNSTITQGKKEIFKYSVVGAVGGLFTALFFVTLVEYFRSLR